MINSYKGKIALAISTGIRPKGFPTNLVNSAARKIKMLHDAEILSDLKAPPGNRLEQLSGNRTGQHSIRINRQWRVCFEWSNTGPVNVEIVDYH